MNLVTRGAGTILAVWATLIAAGGSFLWAQDASQEQADSSAPNAPIVRLASPEGGAHVMEPAAGKKLLIILEIVDVTGAGIKVDRSGTPKFIDASRNVSLFASEVVARGTFVNHEGHEVTQIVSLVPVDKLVLEEKERLSPPYDLKHIRRPTEGERVIIIPDAAMLPFARFRFQVEDLQGNRSSPYAGDLSVGFAPAVFEPTEDDVK